MTSSDIQANPQHIAIIMDGNGRWAKKRSLPRTAGHRQGIEAVKRTVRAAADLGVPYLTLFGFSAENWGRPQAEVRELMHLLRLYLRSETAALHENGICLKMIGDRSGLEADIVAMIESAEKLTSENTKLYLTIALNYSGRKEIARAAYQTFLQYAQAEHVPNYAEFEQMFPRALMTGGLPDPDILIRTSGEQRISNFLLWQCAYSEFVFTDTLWPDFDKDILSLAIAEYRQRERRFGVLSINSAPHDASVFAQDRE